MTDEENKDREMQRRMDDGPAGLSEEALHYYNKWDALHAENERLKLAIRDIERMTSDPNISKTAIGARCLAAVGGVPSNVGAVTSRTGASAK